VRRRRVVISHQSHKSGPGNITALLPKGRVEEGEEWVDGEGIDPSQMLEMCEENEEEEDRSLGKIAHKLKTKVYLSI